MGVHTGCIYLLEGEELLILPKVVSLVAYLHVLLPLPDVLDFLRSH